MKSLPGDTKPAPEPADETVRVSRANAQARIAPTREGYVNAIQVWPYTDGALYQVYAAPERVTVISLQPGEELVTVAAGDTVRWIVGDTSSGSGSELHVNVLVKPIRSGLKTNLVITTSRRTYLLELTSTGTAWMASVSWEYPKDKMLALQHQAQAAQASAPVESGLSLEKIRFRYAISGSNPPWKPMRAFDDGEKVYISTSPPYKVSEQAMAKRLLPAQLRPDMLLLADRNFYGFKLWNLACQSGAKLVWRAKSDLKLPVEQLLPDGSWLSTIHDSTDRRRQHGQRVRVVEYVVNEADTKTQVRYRLLTNFLTPDEAPAQELAALYHERWEIENAFDELKTHLRGASTVLRSKTPELVKQEMWGLLLAHFAVRQLMTEAACHHERDPDDLSFVHTVRVIKRKMPQAAAIPP
jgi:P-type conjugative transfer protein TrbG